MGLTLIDAGVLIGFLDGNDAHHLAARDALAAARGRADQVAMPASAFAEALVSPSRSGDTAVRAVREFADRLPLVISAPDVEIAVVAAGLRAKHGQRLRLPDALVVATAIHSEADVLVTTDRSWPTKRALGYRGSLIKL
jgi:predicted nucleic acid-binding protein